VTTRLVNRRIRLVVAAFALIFAATLARAFWLQGVRAGNLDALAAIQHREDVTLEPHRGTIYDRLGRALAIGEQATSVYANPRHITDPQAAAERVAAALDLKAEKLLPLLLDRSKGFVYLERKADPEKAELLERQHIVGIGFLREERRTYPQRSIGSEVVGYAGTDNKGLAGVELELDDVLGGTAGKKSVVRDPFGRALRVLETKTVEHGRDVYLTLDETLQRHVERILRDTRARWAAKAATATVVDPRTGAVLAMVVEPGFNANRFPAVRGDRQRNRAVTDTYEPGSTFKVVTLAGVLETGLVTPTTRYTLRPRIRVSDRVIHDAEPRGTETMTVAEILSKSSNVGTVTLALGLGVEQLARWIDRFGFGHKTGIEFPGESRGIVLPTSEWSGSTIGNVPIGQGIAVTPIQMASVFATIANGGVAIEPHLVERVEGEGKRTLERKRVISRQTADQLTAMLRSVVREGSGTEAQVPGYSVAGKTGTAAKPDPVLGGYSESKYVSSFVGFAPSTDPRVCILVTVDEPKGNIWGGSVAAPAFSKIAEFALQYLEAAPDQRNADQPAAG
jgi:cell division protein FtsI (penicillin-binding protein 3)